MKLRLLSPTDELQKERGHLCILCSGYRTMAAAELLAGLAFEPRPALLVSTTAPEWTSRCFIRIPKSGRQAEVGLHVEQTLALPAQEGKRGRSSRTPKAERGGGGICHLVSKGTGHSYGS